ncbi:MAG: hypothetical protein IJ955_06925 [Oscillospiraceae bacterium]|nr:hypothetical protein [Oscillospiraceae bacterium]
MAWQVVWVAYDKKPPHLPVAIRRTSLELAECMGVSYNTVQSTWSKFRNGKVSYARYAKVFIEVEDAKR